MARRKDSFEELAGLFLAMSNEVRLAILQLLAKKEVSVTALQKKLQIPQATVSYHLDWLHLADFSFGFSLFSAGVRSGVR